MGLVGSWEEEGPSVVKDVVRLAQSVERVVKTLESMQTERLPKLETELAVLQAIKQARRMTGVLANVVGAVGAALLLTVSGTAVVLWSDVRLLKDTVARLEARQNYTHGPHWDVPPHGRHEDHP